jgi:hypothetical protein
MTCGILNITMLSIFIIVLNSILGVGQSQPKHTKDIFIIIIIIGIQPLGRFGQRPELSQATGIALACCILGKFLGVGCR